MAPLQLLPSSVALLAMLVHRQRRWIGCAGDGGAIDVIRTIFVGTACDGHPAPHAAAHHHARRAHAQRRAFRALNAVVGAAADASGIVALDVGGGGDGARALKEFWGERLYFLRRPGSVQISSACLFSSETERVVELSYILSNPIKSFLFLLES